MTATDDTIRFLGRVSDEELVRLYNQASCFIFPSIYEGFGLPTIEAMKCGCPVLSSDIPVLREVCGDAAIFFNPFLQILFMILLLILLKCWSGGSPRRLEM